MNYEVLKMKNILAEFRHSCSLGISTRIYPGFGMPNKSTI